MILMMAMIMAIEKKNLVVVMVAVVSDCGFRLCRLSTTTNTRRRPYSFLPFLLFVVYVGDGFVSRYPLGLACQDSSMFACMWHSKKAKCKEW